MSSEIAVWEFRYNADAFDGEDALRELLKGVAKTYVFQLERGDGGYNHYQGRLSLFKKRRKRPALRLFPEGLAPNYFEPTVSSEYLKGDNFYCMKEDTRVAGPWTDKDVVAPLTEQMKLFLSWELLPWQKDLMEQTSTFNLRTIDLVYDPVGNAGKSLFSEYLEYKGIAEEVPPYRLMDDIFAWVATRPIKKTYIVDMPRGMKKDRLGDFYSGIEVIKNGVAYDKRYTAKKLRFSRPRIMVFTNELPILSLMSPDRWNIWTISNNELHKYVEDQPENCNINPLLFNN